MAFIFIHLVIIVSALWTAARSVYEPQPYRRGIQESQGIQVGNLTDLPLVQLGYTQDNISSDIHNNSAQLVPLQTFIDLARKDPRGPEAYLREAFPGRLTVFQYENVGLLSLDNRRLYLYKTLAPNASIPVEIVTAEEAGKSLVRDSETPQEALQGRITTKNKGKSIDIRPENGGGNNPGSSKKPPQKPGTSGTQQSSSNKPGTSGTQNSSSKQGSSKPGSSGTPGGSSKPGSSKPGGSGTSSQGGFSKSSGKKQGGSKPSRRPKRHVAYRIRD